MLVRNLLEKYPYSAFHMMTPGGYVDLAPEQVKALLSGESVKAHPGASGYDREMDAEELLNERVHSARWEDGACYMTTDYAAGQEGQAEGPQGRRGADGDMEDGARLRERLKASYESYLQQLRQKPVEDIIGMAAEIAVTVFVYQELGTDYKKLGVENEYKECTGYLLRFEDPLEVARDGWLEYEEFCHRDEELKQVLLGMEDMEAGIGEYPMAEQAGEGAQGQGMAMC